MTPWEGWTVTDATTVVDHNGRRMEIHTEVIEITSVVEPDPAWTFTDSEGHPHRAQTASEGHTLYPTLRQVTGPADWCDSCEDEHTDSWFVCRLCGVTIYPGTRAGRTQYIPGLTSYEIDGLPVSEAEARAFADEFQRSLNDRVNDAGLIGLTHYLPEDGHA